MYRISIIKFIPGTKGAIKCKTTFCIKIRSNCKLDNIDPLIEGMKNNPGRITYISAFFRPFFYYSPSDFVMGTHIVEVKAICETLLKQLQLGKPERYSSPERKICFTILSGRNLVPIQNITDSQIQMENIFYIVNVNDLAPTLYWHGHDAVTYFDHDHDISITSINQSNYKLMDYHDIYKY